MNPNARLLMAELYETSKSEFTPSQWMHVVPIMLSLCLLSPDYIWINRRALVRLVSDLCVSPSVRCSVDSVVVGSACIFVCIVPYSVCDINDHLSVHSIVCRCFLCVFSLPSGH
jgi:hypothetical protein